MASEVAALIPAAMAGYLMGSFPTAYLVVRKFAGKNVLELGTGNVGTMNVHRATNSKALMLLTLGGDVLKGLLAMLAGIGIASALGVDRHLGAAAGGLLAVVGHNYSIYLRFQGGKGLATSAPVLLYFAPPLAALWVVVFFATVGVTRLMVVGQILGTVAVPIAAHFLFPQWAPVIYILAALVFIRHAPRIKNVIQGTEPKLYYKVRTPES